MFDRGQQRRVIDRRCGLADQPISRRFRGGKVDDRARRCRPSRSGGIASRGNRWQVRRHGLWIWLRRGSGLIDRDGSRRRFGRTRRDRLFGGTSLFRGTGFGRNGGRGGVRRRLRPDRPGRKLRGRPLGGGNLGQDVLQALELGRPRFLEAIQPLNRIVFQPGADRIRKPRCLKAGTPARWRHHSRGRQRRFPQSTTQQRRVATSVMLARFARRCRPIEPLLGRSKTFQSGSARGQTDILPFGIEAGRFQLVDPAE